MVRDLNPYVHTYVCAHVLTYVHMHTGMLIYVSMVTTWSVKGKYKEKVIS